MDISAYKSSRHNMVQEEKLILVSSYFFLGGHFWAECPPGRTFEFYEFLRGLQYKIAGLIHFLDTNQLARSTRHSLWQGALIHLPTS